MFIPFVFIIAGGYICLSNCYGVVASHLQKRNISSIPFIGAILLGIGLVLIPSTRRWAWLAMVVDFGTFIFIISIPFLSRQFWRVSRWNFVRGFVVEETGLRIVVHLFRSGEATLKIEFKSNAIRNQASPFLSALGLRADWEEIPIGYSITGLGSTGELIIEQSNDGYVMRCPGLIHPGYPEIGTFDGIRLAPSPFE